jgi:hypothetical protein
MSLDVFFQVLFIGEVRDIPVTRQASKYAYTSRDL